MRVTDSRPRARIPTAVFPACFFTLFCARLPSFNQLEGLRSRSTWRRWLDGHDLPSADELAYVSERIDPQGLRDCLGHIYTRLKRNKVLRPMHGWMLAAVDGHEVNSSYRRCCSQCQQRQITVGGAERTQYYHRLVALQLVCDGFRLMLDVESQRPGEDEVAAALRVVARVIRRHPRCFDVLVGDALYLRPSVIGLLNKHNKYFIATLKENQPELLAEAKTLLPASAPQHIRLPDRPGKLDRGAVLRESEGFDTSSITTRLRVLQATESGTLSERIAGQAVRTPYEAQWFWASTLPADLATAPALFHLARARWKIENEGYNELVTHWHSSHYYHHHPTSMLVLWLMLFMAHAIFHCFHSRNLKPELRHGKTTISFARLIEAELRGPGIWWPPPG